MYQLSCTNELALHQFKHFCCLSVAFACLKKASWVSFLRWILAVAILKIVISNDHYFYKWIIGMKFCRNIFLCHALFISILLLTPFISYQILKYLRISLLYVVKLVIRSELKSITPVNKFLKYEQFVRRNEKSFYCRLYVHAFFCYLSLCTYEFNGKLCTAKSLIFIASYNYLMRYVCRQLTLEKITD